MRIIPLMALVMSAGLNASLFSEESSLTKSLDSALGEAKTEAQDLTKLAQEKLKAGAVEAEKAVKAGVETTKQVASDAQKTIEAGVQKAKVAADDLKGKAAQALKQGEDKLQMLLDFGDEKSLNEAKDYVLSKLKGIDQEEAVAKLLQRGVKGLAPWIEKKKFEAGSTLKMKMAYLSRYVDEPAIANTLKKWMNEDTDALVQEYCARALGHQSSEGVLDALKEKAKKADLPKYVKSALESSIAMLEPKPVVPEPSLTPAPALPGLPPLPTESK